MRRRKGDAVVLKMVRVLLGERDAPMRGFVTVSAVVRHSGRYLQIGVDAPAQSLRKNVPPIKDPVIGLL